MKTRISFLKANSKIINVLKFSLLKFNIKIIFIFMTLFTIFFILKMKGQTCTLPAKPTGLTAIVVSHSEIDLSWNPVYNAVGYNIYNCNGTFIAYTISTSYNHKKRASHTLYSYKINAQKNISCRSKFTSCVSVRTPSINTQLPKLKGLRLNHEVPTGPFFDSTNYIPPPLIKKIENKTP